MNLRLTIDAQVPLKEWFGCANRLLKEQLVHLSATSIGKNLCLFSSFFVVVFLTPAQQLTISPQTPSVVVGNSITLSSSQSVRWTLSGNGALSNETSTSVTYTAPSSIVPQTTMLGCPVLPNDSIFNTRIDSLPVHANSSIWLQNSSQLALNWLPSWGVTYADSATQRVSVKPYYGDNLGNNPVYVTPFPGRNLVKRENGAWNSGAYTSNDHHTLTVDRSSCTFYEYYNELVGLQMPEFSLTEACRYIGSDCNASSAILPYPSTEFAIPSTSTDAAGLPLAPLTWTLADIKAGPQHAVRGTSSLSAINGSLVLWPATQPASGGNPLAPPYGSRFRLKSEATGGPNLQQICGANADCMNMLKALAQYGWILADVGLGNQLELASDAVSDPSVRQAMQLIQNADLGPNSFDIVDESSLQQSPGKFLTPSNGSYAIDPTNGYVTPANYSLITAVPATGRPVQVSIALEGVGIGLRSTSMAIAAGMSGFQIQSWVTPASVDQTVTWRLVSGAGTVTLTGTYIPPTSIAGLTQAVLEVTAAADPNVSAFVYVNVLSNNSGTYSINLNSSSPSTSPLSSVLSKLWNIDYGVEASTANFAAVQSDYPDWVSNDGTLIPEYKQYESVLYTYGGDIHYTAVIPNGNYKVRIMQGQPWNGARPPATMPQTLNSAPEFVVTNGLTVANYYDWQFAVNYAYGTPEDIYVPATVTDNTLDVGIQSITPDSTVTLESGIAPLYDGAFPHLVVSQGAGKGSAASGLEIIPDTSAPHWAIDSQGVSTLAAGAYIQLFVIDWYTGRNDPIWSIVSGPPGTVINSSGLLRMSADPSTLGLPVVVMASDGLYSATLVLNPVKSGSPELKLSLTTLTFTLQAIHSTSALQTLAMTNSGPGPVTLQSVTIGGPNSSDFLIANSTCGLTIPTAASCALQISFTPNSLGSRVASLIITDSADAAPQAVLLSGTGTGAPDLSLSANTLAFGAVGLGTNEQQTVIITNSGTAPLAISGMSITGTFSITSQNCPSSLAVSTSCTVSVEFRPTTLGAVSALLALTTSAGARSIALTGTGVGVPALGLSTSAIAFGSIHVWAEAEQTVIITSGGTAPLAISDISITGSFFSISSQNCPSSLAVSASCSLLVAFKPRSVGPMSASLSINTSGGAGTVSLTGTGVRFRDSR